jgi:hypothetical protein
MMISNFTNKPSSKHESYFYSSTICVTVRVLVMLDIYFVSVKYVFVSIKLVRVCVKLLKI